MKEINREREKKSDLREGDVRERDKRERKRGELIFDGHNRAFAGAPCSLVEPLNTSKISTIKHSFIT